MEILKKKSSENDQSTGHFQSFFSYFFRPLNPKSDFFQVGPDKLEVVASFCYLGDMLSAGGGCEMAVTTRVKAAWKKFRELYQFPHPATSPTRPVAMCTALACGAPCSMPVKLGH